MRRSVARVGLAVVALDLLWLVLYAWTIGVSWTPAAGSVELERAYIRDGTTVRARDGELEVLGEGGFGRSTTSPLARYISLGFHVALAGVLAVACVLLREPRPAEPVASPDRRGW